MTSANLVQEHVSHDAPDLPPAKTLLGFLGSVALATLVAWFVSQVLNHVIVGDRLIPQSGVEGVGTAEYFLLTLLSLLLVTAAIAYAATLSSLRGLALVQVIAIAHFGLHHLLSIVEATVFLPQMSASEVGLGVFGGAMQSMILAVSITVALGKMGPANDGDVTATEPEPMPWWEWLWKFALCSVAYLILYIVAGLLILPFVREYYPELDALKIDPVFIFGLQLRRGAVYVACVVPLLRSLQASRRRIALSTAVLVPIVHGVAGLLVPSEHMAATAWRFAHMIEIGWSNFLFGLLIGYLFSRGIKASSDCRVAEAGVPHTPTSS